MKKVISSILAILFVVLVVGTIEVFAFGLILLGISIANNVIAKKEQQVAVANDAQ